VGLYDETMKLYYTENDYCVRIRKKGFKVMEIGVTHYPRTAGKATATQLKFVLKTFRELIRLYWQIK
jgi:GT2 family glycosyltransferase